MNGHTNADKNAAQRTSPRAMIFFAYHALLSRRRLLENRHQSNPERMTLDLTNRYPHVCC
jgi:hypothetical protein